MKSLNENVVRKIMVFRSGNETVTQTFKEHSRNGQILLH